MVSREAAFAESLQRIRRIAREQGNCISEEQVKEEFSDLEFNDAQLQMVYDYLEKHKVGIGEPVDPDAGLTEEERSYLQIYLDGLEALPVYSDGERRAYTISAMAGDRVAGQRLTESYLKDVADIAKLYSGQGILLEDLIGEGNVAAALGVTMLGALEHASEVQGMLGRMIMDAMEEYIAENAEEARKDKKILDKVNKVAKAADELYEELHRKVTIEEVMQESGMSRRSIEDAIRMSGNKIESLSGE